MKTSIWYNSKTGEYPKKQGYYVTFVGMTMGGGEAGIQMSYFDHVDKNGRGAEWYDNHTSNSNWANVIFWCDAPVYDWYDNMGPTNHWSKSVVQQTMKPAEQEAWANVEEAIRKYEVIKALCRE